MNLLRLIRRALMAATAGVVAFMAGCTSTPTTTAPRAAAPAPDAPPSAAEQAAGPAPVVTVSRASTPRDYRRDAASHLYAQNAQRIYQGKLPPMLYAIGVLQIDVDGKGRVTKLNWMRAPTHAPEVIKEIERTVRQAAPYPIPARMGRVTYTDTWLWHKSGLFQLDTLTEGQL
ncbi:MAG: hypothetical protein ABI606_10485 [Rhodoferax sp.]